MCNSPEVVQAVVPTVAVPLATIMFLVNALVSWVASLFGVRLNWDGPRQLLRAVLRPRVVAVAILVNLATVGFVYARRQARTMPSPLIEIKWMNAGLQRRGGSVGTGRTYTDSTGRVTEVDRQTGGARVQSVAFQQLWRASAGPGVMGAATVAGHSVFVGSVDGYVYEFDESNGTLLRRFFVGSEISPDVVIWKNRLFVGEGTHDMHRARLYAFDLTSGQLLGAVQTHGHTEGTPAVAHDDKTGRDHLLFVAGADGIYSVDPLTLKSNGTSSADTRIRIRVLGGRVYFSTGVRRDAGTKPFRVCARSWRLAPDLAAEMPASGWMPGRSSATRSASASARSTRVVVRPVDCYDIDTGRAGTVATRMLPCCRFRCASATRWWSRIVTARFAPCSSRTGDRRGAAPRSGEARRVADVSRAGCVALSLRYAGPVRLRSGEDERWPSGNRRRRTATGQDQCPRDPGSRRLGRLPHGRGWNLRRSKRGFDCPIEAASLSRQRPGCRRQHRPATGLSGGSRSKGAAIARIAVSCTSVFVQIPFSAACGP
jgi:hypothetical protein